MQIYILFTTKSMINVIIPDEEKELIASFFGVDIMHVYVLYTKFEWKIHRYEENMETWHETVNVIIKY